MMDADAVCERVRQKIYGNENTQINGDFQQNNIQIVVFDKQQLADALEIVLGRTPELFNQKTKSPKVMNGLKSVLNRLFH